MKIIRSVSSLALLAVVVASCYLFAVTRAPQQGGRILALYAEGDALTAVDLFENDPALAMDFEDKFALVRSYFLLDRMREAKQVVDVLLKEQPDNSDIRAYSAALAPGYSMAIKAISEAKELSEEETLLLKLSAASTNRRYQDALRLIQSNPDLPHLLDTSELRLYNLLRARVYFNTEMYDQAHKVLAKSVEMFSDFAPLYELLIKVKVRRNALAGLAEDINVYEALGGSEFTIEFNRGILYERSGDLKKAIEHYTNAIELKPKLGKIYLRRGNCYRYTDQKKLAAEDYSVAYNNDPSLAEALVNLAILKMESGEYRVARQLYDEVVSSHPDFQSGYVERGRFLHANGLVELAEQDYVKAMELAPTDPYCSYLAALLHVEHMNLERAKRFIDITMQRDSSYPRIYVVLGDYHRLKGDDRAAIAEYNNALRLDGRNLEALRKLAQVYIEVREPANAVNAASRALQVYDKDLFSMYYLGLGRLGQGKIGEAQAQFQQILNNDVGFAPAYYGLCLVAFAREETSSAINYLHEAIRWQPATDYVYFRALLGVIDPGLTVGDEEQLVSQISAPFEENSFRLIKTAVEKDAGGVRAVIEQMKTLERDDMQWLVEYLAKAVEGERVYSRPPMRDLRKRTLFSFYVALVYHATGKKDAARSLLRSVVGSYDYLSPEYYLAKMFLYRLQIGR